MAQSHKFKNLDALVEVFPDVPWRASDTEVWVFNSKEEEYVEVSKGQYVVSIADRYEVHDEEPDNAKPAEASKDTPKEAPKANPAEEQLAREREQAVADNASKTPNASDVTGIEGPLTQTRE